jgi:flagellar protein FliO/FliZ
MKSLTITRGAALAGALMLIHPAAAFAASGTGENTPLHLGGSSTVHAASSSSSSIVRTIVGLFIVIAVIYGVAWIMRHAKRSRSAPTGHGLSHLATLPLGNGRSVAIVRAGQEIVLVGVAEHAVTPIRTYTEEEALDLGLVESAGADSIESSAADSSDGRSSRGRNSRASSSRAGANGSSGGPVGRLADTLRRMTVRS